jgi:alkane 1-monooxygenase
MRVESAWWIERKRLERKELPIVSLHNRLIVSWLLQVLLILLSGLIFGKSGVAFLLIHSVVAICFLESVEYLEHYGLKRKKTTENASIFEPLNHGHAWTTRNKVAAWCSFNLGLHSDHHLYGTKQYPMLNTQKTEREMPFNYTVMLLMAMLPPLWFSVMNKKLVNNSV